MKRQKGPARGENRKVLNFSSILIYRLFVFQLPFTHCNKNSIVQTKGRTKITLVVLYFKHQTINMSSEDSSYDSVGFDDFQQTVSGEDDLFDDEEEYFEADMEQPNPTDESQESTDPAPSFEGVDDDWLGSQDEAQSAFSETSSDEDGWNPTEALKEFATGTEALKSARPATPIPDEEVKAMEDANPEPTAENPGEYEIDENNKPWLRHAHRDGALLPVAGCGDDDIYRQDAIFFKTGGRDMSRRTGPPASSYRLPSLVTEEGVLQRVRFNLEKTKVDRELLLKDLIGADRAVKELKADLEDAGEEIGMLKHAVDTRDEKMHKLEGDVDGWRVSSHQWMKAFESQRPLADAERERQMMIEAGVEFNQRYVSNDMSSVAHQANSICSVGTQTSPVEAPADVAAEPKTSQPTDNGTQTDGDSLDIEDYLALARERDELIQENEKLSEQTRRLKLLLNDAKGWIEDRTWTSKATARDDAGAYGQCQPATDSPKGRPSTSSSTDTELDQNERILPYDWTRQSWPERWIRREETMRKSESWFQARDECAAQLDAWEKQMWMNARAEGVDIRG